MVAAIDMTAPAAQAAQAAQSVQAAAPAEVGFGYYVLIISLAVIVALLLAWIHYVNVKHEQGQKQKERSPMLTAAFVTGIFLFIVLAAAALGIIEREWLKEHWYVFSLVFVLAYLILMAEARAKQPKPIEVLKALAEETIDEKLGYESDEWKDDGYIPSVEHVKVMEDERLRGLRSSVAFFVVCRMWRSQRRRFLIGLNTYSGYPVEVKLMPEQHRIETAMTDRPATPAGEMDAQA